MAKQLKLKNFAAAFFYLAVLSVPFYIFRFQIFGLPTTLTEILIYISFLLAALNFLSNRLEKRLIPRAFCLAAAGFVLVALANCFAPVFSVDALGVWKAYFFDGLLLAMNYFLLIDENKAENTQNVLISGALIVSVICLGEFLLGTKTVDGRLMDLDQISPNYLSLYLAPVAVLTMIRALDSKKEKTVPYLISSLIFCLAIYLTGSRGGMLAIIVALVFYLIGRMPIGVKKLNVLRAVAAIILLIGGYALFKPDFGSMGRVGNSSNIRVYIWQTTLEIIQKNPVFGVGLDNYQNYFSKLTWDRINYPEYIAPQALTAHDLYLHLLAVGGPFLLASFIVLLLFSRFYRAPNQLKYAVLAILIYALIDTPFFRNDLALVFWLILALGTKKSSKQV